MAEAKSIEQLGEAFRDRNLLATAHALREQAIRIAIPNYGQLLDDLHAEQLMKNPVMQEIMVKQALGSLGE